MIRAHTHDLQGIAHAAPMLRGERYCQLCHGLRLVGGPQGQPSCYTCHGQLWIKAEPEVSYAPTDHTADRQGFRHHPSTDQVQTVCTTCHGSDLLGEGKNGAPSCFLCHEQKWSG